MEQLRELLTTLFQSKQYTACELNDVCRTTLIDLIEDKDTLIPVVCNYEFGGYGYSEEFLQFCKDLHVEDSVLFNRTEVYYYIMQFGRHCGADAKDVERMGLSRAGWRESALSVKWMKKSHGYKIEEYDGFEKVLEGDPLKVHGQDEFCIDRLFTVV